MSESPGHSNAASVDSSASLIESLDRPDPFVHWLPVFFAIVAVPAVLLLFMSGGKEPVQRDASLALAMLLGLFAAGVWLADDSEQGRALGRISVGMALMVVGLVIWNKLFWSHLENHPELREIGIFRKSRQSYHWPVYGALQPTRWQFALPAVGAGSAIALRVFVALRRSASITRGLLLQLVLLQTLFIWTLAWSEGEWWRPAHLAVWRWGIEDFYSPLDLLSRYVALQGELGTFNRHYPPGFMLTQLMEMKLGASGFTLLITPFVASLTLIAMNALGHEIGLSGRARLIAIALVALSTSLAVYASISPIAMLLPLAIHAATLLIRWLKYGRMLDALLFGALVAAYSFFSFTLVVPGLYLVVLMIAAMRWRLTPLTRPLIGIVASVAVFAAIYLAMYFATGFNLIACLREAHFRVIESNGRSFDHPVRYLLRGSGAVMAYLASCGPAVAILGTTTLGHWRHYRSWLAAHALAVVVTLGLVGLLALGHLETERVWMIFTPLLALPAGAFLEWAGARNRLIEICIVGALVFVLTMEFGYRHY